MLEIQGLLRKVPCFDRVFNGKYNSFENNQAGPKEKLEKTRKLVRSVKKKM